MIPEEIELEKQKAEDIANQNGSADETNKELKNKAEETASQSSVGETNIELEQEKQARLDEQARREKAEQKIVEMKRKLKEAGIEENPDVKEIVEEAFDKKLGELKAAALANEKKLAQENSELRTALKAKQSTSNSSSGSNQVKQNQEEGLKLSSADLALLKRSGLTEEDVKKTILRKKSN